MESIFENLARMFCPSINLIGHQFIIENWNHETSKYEFEYGFIKVTASIQKDYWGDDFMELTWVGNPDLKVFGEEMFEENFWKFIYGNDLR